MSDELAYENALNAYKNGEFAAAAAAAKNLLGKNPDNAAAATLLGLSLSAVGKDQEAETWTRRAIDVDPNNPKRHFNHGLVLEAAGDVKAAMDAYRNALDLSPAYVPALNNLAGIRKKRGELSDAEEHCRRALDSVGDHCEILNTLGNVLTGQGRVAEAIDAYHRALTINPESRETHSNLLFCLNYEPTIDPATYLREHQLWVERHVAEALTRRFAHNNDPNPDRKLKIGYVSNDFRRHSVAYFIQPILHFHNRDEVEVFCYSGVKRPDDVTRGIADMTDHWIDIHALDSNRAAERVHDDGVDVLVDLSSHTADWLPMFARKPAPVQITYLGCPNPTALPTMDYRISDAIADPTEHDSHYIEKPLRLEPGFLCFAPPADAPDVQPPPLVKNGFITFGSCNAYAKMNEPALSLWAEILKTVPTARLLLKNKSLGDERTRRRTLEAFSTRGVDAERIDLMGFIPSLRNHLSVYQRIDVALDTFPYNGTTTTCEALWMGVPVISFTGNNHAGRVGASLLNQVGLNSFVGERPKDYLNLAANLAAEPALIKQLRPTLRAIVAASPLCDGRRFTRGLETAYREAWRKWARHAEKNEDVKR